MDDAHRRLLRQLPSVDEMLVHYYHQYQNKKIPRMVLIKAIRLALENTRQHLLKLKADELPESLDRPGLITKIHEQLDCSQRAHLIPLINATGVIIHTNLGRSPLAGAAMEQIFKSRGSLF